MIRRRRVSPGPLYFGQIHVGLFCAGLLAVTAILPPVPTAVARTAARQAVAPRFDPPRGEITLVRTLWRELRDGKQLMIRRSYLIRFLREGQGWRVEGRQVAVSVDAPPPLAPLAEIERNRQDTGLFPLRLDVEGHIQDQPGKSDGKTDGAMVGEANHMITRSMLTSPQKAEAQATLGALAQANAAGSGWPADLFNPAAAEQKQTQRVPLADGSEGQTELTLRAEGFQTGHIPQKVERIVVTRIGDSARTGREEWLFQP